MSNDTAHQSPGEGGPLSFSYFHLMRFSPDQFEKHLQDNSLIISLIGMSSIGKTAWSRKLTQAGFQHINCDDIIEEKLGDELKRLGYSGLADVGRWMGHPYEDRYIEKEKKYLDLEVETMKEILDWIRQGRPGNKVIDTTGSVIHTGDRICNQLREISLVIHFQASEEKKEKLYRKYLTSPKPVVFAGHFEKQTGESNSDALQRSYRNLLETRSRLYEQYADLTIPSESLTRDMVAVDFFRKVTSCL